jgi:hypothetical protein
LIVNLDFRNDANDQEVSMVNHYPPIYFYLPQPRYTWLARHLPKAIDRSISSLNDISELLSYFYAHPDTQRPQSIAFPEKPMRASNPREVAMEPLSDVEFNWIVQTCLYLKLSGFPCELTGTMPDEGILFVASSSSLPRTLKPKPKILLVYLQGDRMPHAYAHLQVVQNKHETRYFQNSYFIQHWVHTGLIPRDPARGDRFEVAAFFGKPSNLAPELLTQEWETQLSTLGLKWCFKAQGQWHNYSDVDVIVAIRSFNPDQIAAKLGRKPASKLYNAWHAGVPAILGDEPAFRDERHSDLDYIEVDSLQATIAALKQLRDRPEFRHAMVENGRVRAQETTPSKIIEQWEDFLVRVAIPNYERWYNTSSIHRQLFLIQKSLDLKTSSVRYRLKKATVSLGRRVLP